MKLITFDTLYHVGDLEQPNFTNKNHSLEGPCLSVSEYPEEWREICRLGNAPLWTLTKKSGCFIDAHACSEDFIEKVQNWGVDEGLVVVHQGIKTAIDSEDGTRYALSLSLEEAIAYWGDEDEGASHQPEVIFAPTEKAQEFWESKVELLDVQSMLLVFYADKMLDIDGVLWNDELDVYSYSAPRAGILPRKVRTWKLSKQA